MARFISFFLFLALVAPISSALSATQKIDGLAVSTFGDATKQALLFVHGGPGFNSRDFEVTTAAKLAARGYYVITFDERGQGRSGATDAKNYNYRQYANDIHAILTQLHVKAPILLGHSHGGPVATKFDELYPGVAKAVVLVSAPVNFWAAMESMHANCAARLEAAHQVKELTDLNESFASLAKQRKGSAALVEPLAKMFAYAAVSCKLMDPAHPTAEALALKKLAIANPAPAEQRSMPGFLVNESYVYLDHSAQVRKSPGRYFGIYGAEDGLFNRAGLDAIAYLVGSGSHFFLVKGASHAVYVDQQPEFFRALDQIVAEVNAPDVVSYYFGEATFLSADGKQVFGKTPSLVKRVIQPRFQRINETVLQPPTNPEQLAQDIETSLVRIGKSNDFNVTDNGHTFSGVMRFTGTGWNLPTWTYDLKLRSGGKMVGKGSVGPEGIKTEKVFQGEHVTMIREDLRPITAEEYARRHQEMLNAN